MPAGCEGLLRCPPGPSARPAAARPSAGPARPFSRPLPPGTRREPPHGSGCPQTPRFHSGPSAGVRGGTGAALSPPRPLTPPPLRPPPCAGGRRPPSPRARFPPRSAAAAPGGALLAGGSPRPLPPALGSAGGGERRPPGMRGAAEAEAAEGGCQETGAARKRAGRFVTSLSRLRVYRQRLPGSRDSVWAERPGSGSGSSRSRAGARLSWGRGRQAANPRRGASAEAAEVASG